MPEPKALTPEQINLLRGLPGSRDERLTTPEERGVIGVLLGTPRGVIDTLLATIDSERERVLAEAMNVVRDAAAFEESQGDGAVTSNYLRELADRIERGERPPFEHTRAGLAYPYPQKDTDQ